MKSICTLLTLAMLGNLAHVHGLETPATPLVKRQPVFLLCPHRTKFSAWSLYLEVETARPWKVQRLGLDELSGLNSKDATYEAVLAAQHHASTKRKDITALNAADFGKKDLCVEKYDALRATLEPVEDGTFRLLLSLRVGASERFVIGGANSKRNAVSLKFDATSKTWSALATALEGSGGEKLVRTRVVPISGLLFPLSDTGIHTMLGVVNDSTIVTLMDRSLVQK